MAASSPKSLGISLGIVMVPAFTSDSIVVVADGGDMLYAQLGDDDLYCWMCWEKTEGRKEGRVISESRRKA